MPRDVFSMFPLDRALSCEDGEFDFVKIDTEGYIMPIIRGGTDVFRCIKGAVIEVPYKFFVYLLCEVLNEDHIQNILNHTSWTKACRDVDCQEPISKGTGDIYFFR